MPDPRPRRPTSRDVAAAAGVSRSTVSFVLNNTPDQTIPATTRQAVLRAAEELGYVPSANATALRKGRSDLALLLVPPWAQTQALSSFVNLTAEHLAAHGLVTVTHVSAAPRLRSLLAVVSPAVVLSMAPLEPADSAQLEQLGIAHVAAYLVDYPEHPQSMTLTQQLMGAAQARHLVARGYTELLYVEGPEIGHPSRPDGRYDGARRTAAALGLPTLSRVAYSHEDELDDLVSAWARSPRRIGVCAFDDLTALAVLAHLRGGGVPVPERVGVIGVDDIPAARHAEPPLSTAHLQMDSQARQLATRAASALGRTDAGTPLPDDAEEATVTVVTRGST